MSADITDIRERLARIETTQEHQGKTLTSIDAKLDGMNSRVRAVELTSATYGSISGGIISIAVAYITARLKSGA